MTRLSRWDPQSGELAVRFDLRQPRCALGNGLIVERGQAAVLSLGGGKSATLQPGSYSFDDTTLADLVSLGAVGGVDVTFVVTADVDLRIHFADLLSADHLPASGEGTVTVRVARPGLFRLALMRGLNRYTDADLCRTLSKPVTAAMTEVVGRMSAYDLDSASNARSVAAGLEQRLAPALDALGLEFVELRSVEFRQEAMMRERRELGQVLLAERELEVLKRRIAAWEQMSDLAARLAAAEARHQHQLAEVRRSLETRAQDQDLIRRHLREKMELQHRLELARMQSGAASAPAADTPASPTASLWPAPLRRATAAYAAPIPSPSDSRTLA
jgi:hypothetical protein